MMQLVIFTVVMSCIAVIVCCQTHFPLHFDSENFASHTDAKTGIILPHNPTIVHTIDLDKDDIHLLFQGKTTDPGLGIHLSTVTQFSLNTTATVHPACITLNTIKTLS